MPRYLSKPIICYKNGPQKVTFLSLHLKLSSYAIYQLMEMTMQIMFAGSATVIHGVARRRGCPRKGMWDFCNTLALGS